MDQVGQLVSERGDRALPSAPRVDDDQAVYIARETRVSRGETTVRLDESPIGRERREEDDPLDGLPRRHHPEPLRVDPIDRGADPLAGREQENVAAVGGERIRSATPFLGTRHRRAGERPELRIRRVSRTRGGKRRLGPESRRLQDPRRRGLAAARDEGAQEDARAQAAARPRRSGPEAPHRVTIRGSVNQPPPRLLKAPSSPGHGKAIGCAWGLERPGRGEGVVTRSYCEELLTRLRGRRSSRSAGPLPSCAPAGGAGGSRT